MIRRAVHLAAFAGLAASVCAQSPFTTGSTVTYTLGFVDIGGNANGTIEPGESALIQLDISFSNQNTTASYSPGIPAPGSGTIRGFGSGYVDLIGSANNGGNSAGLWDLDQSHGYGGHPDWDWQGHWGGTPVCGGKRLNGIGFGQFPVNASAIWTTNPIHLVWQGLWTPTSYAPRTVTFVLAPAAASGGIASSVLFKVGVNNVAGAGCPSNFGSVCIPLLPAPAAAPLLSLILLAHHRRRPKVQP